MYERGVNGCISLTTVVETTTLGKFSQFTCHLGRFGDRGFVYKRFVVVHAFLGRSVRFETWKQGLSTWRQTCPLLRDHCSMRIILDGEPTWDGSIHPQGDNIGSLISGRFC